jgi:hypothetical protein
MQQHPPGPKKAQFFHDGLHYDVHREGKMVVVSHNDTVHRRFPYGTERTELEQRAQWKIAQVDPQPTSLEQGDDDAET